MKPTCLNCRKELPLQQWLTMKKPSLQCQTCGYANQLKPWVLLVSGVLLLVLIAAGGLIVYGYTQDQYSRGGVRMLLFGAIAVLLGLWIGVYYLNPVKS